MDYLDCLLQGLKHKNLNIDDDVMKYCLWYSCNKESYIQRTSKYDGTFLSYSDSDPYISALIVSLFNINNLLIFSKQCECNKYARSLSNEIINDSFMLIYSKGSLFFSLYDKIRNSFAHGQFNVFQEMYYFLGQGKAKKESDINFLLQTKYNVFNSLKKLLESVELSLSSPMIFKAFCLRDLLQLEFYESIIDSDVLKCYSKKYKSNLIIDDSFSFKTTEHHSKEINDLLEKYSCETRTVVIVPISLRQFKESSLLSYDNQVRIIDSSMIFECFDIDSIEYI